MGNRMNKYFTEHPATVGETYREHMSQAFRFSGRLFVASLACFVHGLIPCWHEKTGSETVAELYDRMIKNRHLQTPSKATWVESARRPLK